jgi:hypothetical protein
MYLRLPIALFSVLGDNRSIPLQTLNIIYPPADETFRLSFTLIDEAGTLLDETPATECVLSGQPENISTAFFYASFPRTGVYTIAVYKNGICIETIPLEVTENQRSRQHPMVPIAPLESGVSG